VAAYIGNVFVDVCVSHCSGVDCSQTVPYTHINKDTTNSRLLPNSRTYTHQQEHDQ